MSSMKFEIDIFSRHNNFNIWKIQMMVLLRREGSIHAINRNYPDKISDSDKEKIERYALSVIQLSLAPNILCEVSTSTNETAKELWKRLEVLYQDRLVTIRKLLQRRLHIHLRWIQDGIKKDEETLACTLLFSLTSKYHDIENSMMYSKEYITLEKVRQTHNCCDVLIHFEGDKGDEVSGLFVRGRSSQ
ncbi:hypothetical protein KY289_030579 [Solanum tuberosum]|nr:hypothetical protein KY289_030579 [Solanum tuberosum]